MTSVGPRLPLVTLPTDPNPSKLHTNHCFAPPPLDRNSPDWQRLDAKIPDNHLARQIDQAVDQLDLTILFNSYKGRGSTPYRPDLLLKVVLYELHRKRSSPAQWHEDLLLDEACQWLAFGIRPGRSRLYAFRDRQGPLLDGLHNGVIAAAVTEGLSDGSQASLDGSAVAANGSRHRLLNEDSLSKREQALAEARAEDKAASQTEALPAWMATTPAGRQEQQQRYAKAHDILSERLRQNQQRPASKRLAVQHVRVSPGDPQAALGLDKFKVFRPLYNVQMMPDLNSPLVLAYEVFAQATDAATLPTMLQRCRAATGRQALKDLLTDAGYATALDLAACQEEGVTLYAPYQENELSAQRRQQNPPKQIPKEAFRWLEQEQVYQCPEGHRLEREYSELVRRKGEEQLRVFTYRCPPEHCRSCPRRQECARVPERGRTIKRSEYEELVEALKERMATAGAKKLYKRRCQTAELSFADSKEHRGLRRFSGHGLKRARIEVGLVVLAHNLLAILKLREQRRTATNATHDPPPT
jgi:transposase